MATDPGKLPNEIDIVRDVSERLDRAGIPFMLTFPRKHGEFRETGFGRRRRVTITGQKRTS